MSPREPLHPYQEACDVCECGSRGHQDGHGPVAPVAHAIVEVPGGRRAEVRPPQSQGSRTVSALRKLQVGNHKQRFPALYQCFLYQQSSLLLVGTQKARSRRAQSHRSEGHYTSSPTSPALHLYTCMNSGSGITTPRLFHMPATVRSMASTAPRDEHTLGSNPHTASCWLIGTLRR